MNLRRSSFLLALTLAAAPCVPLLAAPTVDERTAEEHIEALEKKVQELDAEVRAHRATDREGGSAGPGEASDRVAELERKLEALTRELERMRVGEAAPPEAREGAHGLGPAASKVYAVKRGVSIGGYGEMLFEAPADERDDGSPSGRGRQLDLLRAVVYAGYKFSDRLLFNSEIEIEHATTGEGAEEKGEVSTEFAYLDFLFHPEASLRAGLLLVPMGFINELHEPPTYLGARRPLVEQLVVPSTWREAGVGVFGESGPLAWRAYVVNGLRSSGYTARGLREARQGGSRARAEDFALTGRLDYKPTLATLVGGSLFTGHAAQGEGDFSAATTIVDLHGEVRERGFEARALYARASIGDAGLVNAANGLEGQASVGSRLHGGYLQVGYDVLLRGGGGQSLVPFFRWEKVDTQARVPAGFERSGANEQRLLTFGASYKPHPQVVLKLDYQDVKNEAGTGTDQLNLALGYIF